MHLIVLLSLATAVYAQYNPGYDPGRTTMVHLFEWRWDDIADECERFLGPKGYGGVQVSPINENIIGHAGSVQRPWWERYQGVSFNIITRSGDEGAFRSMVQRCNNVGVRIYVDAVFNQLAGGGWTGTTGGSSYDAGGPSYPAIPFGPNDFTPCSECPNSSCDIGNSYDNPNAVRNCRLSGMPDVRQGSDYVRGKLLEFFNKLVEMGVAGFRFDAAKHMWPGDVKAIVDSMPSTSFGKPFIFQEVIDLGYEPIKSDEYTGNGVVTEFKYSTKIGEVFRQKNGQKLAYLKNFGEGWGMISGINALVFVDNHDNQRGHGAGGPDIITHKESKLYKMAVGFMLAYPYGWTRVMSSYFFENTDEGPPHDSNYNTINVPINADDTCGGGWACEHRWRQIYNMVAFRNTVFGTTMNDWWDDGGNQIAFCRGGKGFVAINNAGYDMKQTLQTCLPAGTYCDIISGNPDSCVKQITVGGDGRAYIEILAYEDDGILAIHEGSRLF
ncbi:alpha-amylase 4N-like isoform X2 [Artemia franciscana]|uniref:alpha-amylase 4N-like isoform X2 n=1 Tax=Artemia franciscana TaxID=6661 RepID=UPI0032DAB2B4